MFKLGAEKNEKTPSFKKLEELLPEQKAKLIELLHGKSGCATGAKYLFALGGFKSQASAYQYLHQYLKYNPAFKDLAKQPLTSSAKQTCMELEKLDTLLQSQLEKAENGIKLAMSSKGLLERMNDFNALREMTYIAHIQHARTLKMLAEEEKAFEKSKGKTYMLNGVQDNLESSFTMYQKIAQLQMDLGVLHKQEKAEQHLHITMTDQQQQIVKQYQEQQLLSDVRIEAMAIMMEPDEDES